MTDNNYDYEGRYEGEEIDDLLDIVKKSKADILDIDNIRKDAALGATALQSVPDEYVTEEELEAKGYAVARNVANALATKVTAVKGKGLSTEDFTTELKGKLEALSNYDDSEIAEAIEKLRSDIDVLVDDSQSLDSIIASIEVQIASKQESIADLSTIREGASKGATAVQGIYVNGSYNGRKDGKGNIDLGKVVSTISVNGEEITPDANGVADLGEIGGSTDLSNYYTKSEVDNAISSAIITTLNTPV